MNIAAHDQMIEALRSPDAWPWPVSGVELKTTHISSVLLADERVIKLKRPVRYSFVDYSTLEKRHAACLDEVRLNRLLADDIYLGVVPIVRDGAGCRIGSVNDSGDDAVEWVTLMRRIDDTHLLDGQLERGERPPDLAERLAERLVPFHLGRPSFGADDPEAMLQSQLDVVTKNLDELRPFTNDPLPAGELSLIDGAMRAYIRSHRDLMRARVADGWIREGHGDLRCEHAVVPPEGAVQIYDCVEFNPDIRRADVASDLAFLLMDLSRLGAPSGVVQALLRRYEAAGIDLPVGVLRFYWIHRALVRAKVHCLRLDSLAGDQRSQVHRKAVDYLHVACRQALTVQPAVVAMTGLSGTGKSTVARALARATGAVFLDTDVIRKDPSFLGGELAASRGEDIYTSAWTKQTYDRMIDEGIEVVRRGGIAILDGTFLDRDLRDQAADAARDLDVPFVMVEVRCDENVVLRRLESRMRDPRRTSDAGVDIHFRQRDRLGKDPPGLPDSTVQVVVDTTPEGPASLDPVLDVLKSTGILVPGIEERPFP